MRRAVRVLLVAVTVGGILFLFVLPARTYFQQGGAMAAAQRRLAALNAENAALVRKAAQLRNPAYIERIARQEYGLVKPGEQAYGILLPAPTTTTTTITTTTTTTTTPSTR